MISGEGVEKILDEHFVFRNIHFISYKKWEPKRRPNETDFVFDEDGMSVTWETKCDIVELFVILGMSKSRKGNFLNPKEFKVIKLNVGDLRTLELSNDYKLDVHHSPTPENIGHASVVCQNFSDEIITEIRLKLCDMVEKFEQTLHEPDYSEVQKILHTRKET
jgi:hypothetical protein